MTMKAFFAMVKNEEWGILVHAKTPGKARSRFIRCEPSMDIDRSFWNDIRLTRVPALDNKPFTYKNVLDAGYMYINLDVWDEWDNYGGLATYDSSRLTELVVLCFDNMLRLEINPKAFNYIELVFHQRKTRDMKADIASRLPEMDEMVKMIRDAIGLQGGEQ